MNRLSEIRAEAQADWSRLQACWEAARAQWHDEVADNFTRRRWQEWDQQTRLFLHALEELEQIASDALRETS
jgi:hypothetical protein